MAIVVWGAGSGPQTSTYSTGTNWTGDAKPGAGDDVVFNSTDVTNCTLDEATAAINSLTVEGSGGPTGDYSGTLDFNDFSVPVTGGGDMTFDGSGTVDCGASTITCSGNFDNKDQTTWTRGTSTLVMNGASKTITGSNANDLYALEINESTELVVGTTTRLDVHGGLTVAAGKTFTLSQSMDVRDFGTLTANGTITIASGKGLTVQDPSLSVPGGGGISGDGTLTLRIVTVTSAAGTINPAMIVLHRSCTLAPGTYGGTVTAIALTGTRTLTFSAGTFVFTGDVTFDADVAGNTYTIDLATNDVDVEFQGDVTLSESGGGGATLAWSKPPTGTITFGGTTDYTDSTAAIQNLGDVDVDGTSLKLLTEMECDDFTGTSGTFDPNGQTLDAGGNVAWGVGFDGDSAADAFNGCAILVAGNFTANAQTLKATAGWTLTVTGTAVASGVGAVAHSNAGGGTEITASAGPWTDNLNNTNWDFGGGAGTVNPFSMGAVNLLQGKLGA